MTATLRRRSAGSCAQPMVDTQCDLGTLAPNATATITVTTSASRLTTARRRRCPGRRDARRACSLGPDIVTRRQDEFDEHRATPERSLDQRMDALRRANEVRALRAQLKRDLKARRVSIGSLLLNPPPCVETAKVFDMLLASPGWRCSSQLRRAEDRPAPGRKRSAGGATVGRPPAPTGHRPLRTPVEAPSTPVRAFSSITAGG